MLNLSGGGDEMKTRMLVALIFWLAMAGLTGEARAGSPEDSFGWRGNYTGLWPEAKVPTEWSYQAKGVMAELHCSTRVKQNWIIGNVDDGFLRDWLVLGPFEVADSVKDFDAAQGEKEGELSPAEGDKVGDRVWQKLEVPAPGRYTFGPTELEFVDLGKVVEFKLNEVAYAHTYLHSHK